MTVHQATFATQCTQLAIRLSSITTATTGQTNIGSGTQLDLLMMGIQSGKILHTLHTSCHPTLQHHDSYNRTDKYRHWNAVGSPDDRHPVRQHSPHSATQLATRLSSITTATTGQTNIESGTQLDLLMMGIQ